MIKFICDTPERIPARIFRSQLERAGGCYCCAFWRGFLGGIALSVCVAIPFILYRL